MSQIDKIRVRSFFADLLLPLKHANTRRNVHYLSRTPQQASYWQPVISRTGGLQRLSAASSSGSALLELLGRYWVAQDDQNLPKLLPYLDDLRREIVESQPVEDAKEPRLPDFVYPIF